jgi:hypothetical protein
LFLIIIESTIESIIESFILTQLFLIIIESIIELNRLLCSKLTLS